jgi:hypothetical protein
MSSQQFLVCDNSTAANYKAWASALSNFIRSVGWVNSSDTGQLNGAGGGNWTSVTTVPGSGAYYYEVFQPGDALTTFYLKVEYGNATGSSNSPNMRLSIGSTTNGAGTLTGWVTWTVPCGSSITAPSTTTQYECNFSGANNRLSIMMWRTAPNSAPQMFCVERSLNASGTPVGTYVSLWAGGGASTVNFGGAGFYQTIHFTAGYTPASVNWTINAANYSGIPALVWVPFGNSSPSFNGSIGFANAQPNIGYWDYPCTVLGFASPRDLTDGVPFTITNQYGQSVKYMPTRSGFLYNCAASTWNNGNQGSTLCVRFD